MIQNIAPATSRAQKFSKLAKTSLHIIRKFGFLYFASIALTEFKKQKWSIFSPDNPSSDYKFFTSKSNIDTYKFWINNKFEKIEKKFLNENSNLQNYTQINVIVTVPQDFFQSEYLKDTISSIINQSYNKWKLFIFFINSSFADKLDKNELNIEPNSNIKILTTNESFSINDLVSTIEGKFLVFVDFGILLHKNALLHLAKGIDENKDADIIYTDEDKIDENGNHVLPFFKPDWSPYLFLSTDYVSKFFVISRKIFNELEGFRKGFAEYDKYDLLLRAVEKTNKIIHIPLPLCSIKTNNKKLSSEGINAVKDALSRRKIEGSVEVGLIPNSLRIKYFIDKEPKVSIIIPTRDQKNNLKRCIKSIEKKTAYKNWEIIVADNSSEKDETISYLNSLPYKVIKYDQPFNFSKINNLAVKHAEGDFLLFLNDDTAVLEPNWLHEMVGLCQQKDVGAVGAKLLFVNDTIQHAGMVFLKTGSGFHPFQKVPSKEIGYNGFVNLTREYLAVTGACLLTKKEIFDKIGGYDNDFDLYYGDSDLCFKIIQEGYRIVYTPYAVLLHQGSSKIREFSQGFFAVENHYRFVKKWPKIKDGDPYYSPNLGWNFTLDNKMTFSKVKF